VAVRTEYNLALQKAEKARQEALERLKPKVEESEEYKFLQKCLDWIDEKQVRDRPFFQQAHRISVSTFDCICVNFEFMVISVVLDCLQFGVFGSERGRGISVGKRRTWRQERNRRFL